MFYNIFDQFANLCLYSCRQHEGLTVEEKAKKLEQKADHEENMKVKCTKYQCLQVRGGYWSFAPVLLIQTIFDRIRIRLSKTSASGSATLHFILITRLSKKQENTVIFQH
jgi:hypothetical protein